MRKLYTKTSWLMLMDYADDGFGNIIGPLNWQGVDRAAYFFNGIMP